jgi:hypothetical protein
VKVRAVPGHRGCHIVDVANQRFDRLGLDAPAAELALSILKRVPRLGEPGE